MRLCEASIGLLALFSTVSGCQRKAPGPDECLQFAEAFVGMARDDERSTLRVEAEIDEVVQLCLTVPYDRELIACAQSGRARRCFDAYKLRTRPPL
jgi:hypothetical protein